MLTAGSAGARGRDDDSGSATMNAEQMVQDLEVDLGQRVGDRPL
jgi:hypothetical protein